MLLLDAALLQAAGSEGFCYIATGLLGEHGWCHLCVRSKASEACACSPFLKGLSSETQQIQMHTGTLHFQCDCDTMHGLARTCLLVTVVVAYCSVAVLKCRIEGYSWLSTNLLHRQLAHTAGAGQSSAAWLFAPQMPSAKSPAPALEPGLLANQLPCGPASDQVDVSQSLASGATGL